ncbi:unnamed protein product [Allacma fusca]|uniref:Serine carboxypeptidase n=2 Tax=Allacma fusca TaxID=39272 RepID=A0A8J2KBN0_9HEXA|nr:unnamed protein product [Allacma fusca]
MKKVFTVALPMSTLTLILVHEAFNNYGNSCSESGGELFLTPLIKSGEYDKARAAAEDNMNLVHANFKNPVKSFSGYLTIDEKYNSNLFFWFFPAQEKPEKAPVILWVNDVPGHTSLKGIFLENGPFILDENGEIQERAHTWTKTHSMLYIDAPVGSGFSFADNHTAYANNSDEEAEELYEALVQFFTLFCEYQTQNFYLAGETFAASFIAHTAKKIDAENANGSLKINLKGFVLGSPFLDFQYALKNQVEFYYNLGLIDKKQSKVLQIELDKGLRWIKEEKYTDAHEQLVSTVYHEKSLVNQFTGFEDYRSVLNSQVPPEIARFQKFMDSKEVHQFLHVGLHKFVGINYEVWAKFTQDIFNSHMTTMAEMLDKGYRVLMYVPQFDYAVHAEDLIRTINDLKWKGAEGYAKAPRKIWKIKDEIAGYTKSYDNLVFALVRNAGNYAILEQPEWVLDIVEKFLYGAEI